jgi:hypothetical protein
MKTDRARGTVCVLRKEGADLHSLLLFPPSCSSFVLEALTKSGREQGRATQAWCYELERDNPA